MTNTVYASVQEFLAHPDISSNEPADDTFIAALLERASRDGVDGYTGQWFYAYEQTRMFDAPQGRELFLDAPLLSVTSLTNGDGTTIAATDYTLRPNNGPHRTSIRLKATSSVAWVTDSNGDAEGVIEVTGRWGYVDRDATDPESRRVISATKTACLQIALATYKKRYGVGAEGVATVTAAGVVITPNGIPVDAKERLEPLKALL